MPRAASDTPVVTDTAAAPDAVVTIEEGTHFVVLTPIRHSGADLTPGAIVAFEEKHAAPLLAVGAIRPADPVTDAPAHIAAIAAAAAHGPDDYIVVTPLQHNGATFAPGAVLTLEHVHAAPLLAVGTVRQAEQAAPAGPVDNSVPFLTSAETPAERIALGDMPPTKRVPDDERGEEIGYATAVHPDDKPAEDATTT